MWNKLISQAEDLSLFAFLALVFGFIKLAMAQEKKTVKQMLVALMVSVAVGTLAGGFALEMGMGEYATLILTSISSLLSQDIILLLIKGELLKRAAENTVDKLTK